jgi:nucleoside 2-deoxyribosyltransferase
MRIYLAAPYAVRDELRALANELEDGGHQISASWLEATHAIHSGTLATAPDADDAYCRDHVIQDMEDVGRSDLVIVFNFTYCSKVLTGRHLGPNSGGRHVETGAALALGIPVVVVGGAENIFHRGACTVVEDWSAAKAAVQSLHDKRFGIDPDAQTESD